jgi:hypothetical protein
MPSSDSCSTKCHKSHWTTTYLSDTNVYLRIASPVLQCSCCKFFIDNDNSEDKPFFTLASRWISAGVGPTKQTTTYLFKRYEQEILSKLYCKRSSSIICLFRIISIPSKTFIFVCQITWFWWNVRHWTSGVNVHTDNSNR